MQAKITHDKYITKGFINQTGKSGNPRRWQV